GREVMDLIGRLRKEEGRRAVRLGNSLTTKYAHREDMRAMLREAADALEADRKRRGEPVAWPLASPEDADKGWTRDYRFIEQVERIASQHTDYTTSMEATEQVLIAANEVLRASQPAEQQPVEGEENRMNTHDIELPPLPTGYKSYEFPDGGYDADEMQAYARAAIEAHRKQGGSND